MSEWNNCIETDEYYLYYLLKSYQFVSFVNISSLYLIYQNGKMNKFIHFPLILFVIFCHFSFYFHKKWFDPNVTIDMYNKVEQIDHNI